MMSFVGYQTFGLSEAVLSLHSNDRANSPLIFHDTIFTVTVIHFGEISSSFVHLWLLDFHGRGIFEASKMFSCVLLTAILLLLRYSMALPSIASLSNSRNLILNKRLISASSDLDHSLFVC